MRKSIQTSLAIQLIIFFAAFLHLMGQVHALRAQTTDHSTLSPKQPVKNRVVFLGDSITYSGQYIGFVETALRLQPRKTQWEILNLGVPSETVSGLSEPGHAGGQFPRPDLAERLDRVLAKTRPEIVFVCYGINDGIYFPYSLDRFASFRKGIEHVRSRASFFGARVIHLTPATFDSFPIRSKTLPAGRDAYPQPYEGYDQVLDLYSAWLVGQRAKGWEVFDLHSAMCSILDEKRRDKPDFRFAGDGVHPNDDGHWVMANEILRGLKVTLPQEIAAMEPSAVNNASPSQQRFMQTFKRVMERQNILRDAWLTETGHKRPGLAKGLPLAEANAKAEKIQKQLDE